MNSALRLPKVWTQFLFKQGCSNGSFQQNTFNIFRRNFGSSLSRNSSTNGTALLGPFAFASFVGGGVFCGTAYLLSSRLKRKKLMSMFPPSLTSNSVLRYRMLRLRQFFERFPDYTRFFGAILAINLVIFGLWRKALAHPQSPLLKQMRLWFTCSPFRSMDGMKKPVAFPMLFAMFSHTSLVHLAVNMYILKSFMPMASDRALGWEQFSTIYLCSGLLCAMCSYVSMALVGVGGASLGASGCIYGLLSNAAVWSPDARFTILGLNLLFPDFSITPKQIMIIAPTFEMIGLILTFTRGYGLFGFDHAGHLGGFLFGFWYAHYGRDLWKRTCARFLRTSK